MSNSKIYLCFCIALIFVVLLSINIGPVEAGWSDLLSDSFERDVLLNIRLPRLILGLIVGMALSSCGASMQGLFRNPLADPGLIGISSGAALFVAIIIVIFSNLLDGITGLYIYLLQLFVVR